MDGGYAGGSTWIKPKAPYDIPMRCLIPKDVDGLVMTGRNISAAHEPAGSLRVQGTVHQRVAVVRHLVDGGLVAR